MWSLEANSAVWTAGGRPSGRLANGQISDRWANDQISDRWANGRPAGAGRPWPGYREQSSLPIDRPVDWGHFQRAELSGGRPGRSTGPPAKQGCARLYTLVDRSLDR